MNADILAEQDRDVHSLLRMVIATQWHEDAWVKFKQVELDSHDLSALFIDVEAIRTKSPRCAGDLMPASSEPISLGGAAHYLFVQASR